MAIPRCRFRLKAKRATELYGNRRRAIAPVEEHRCRRITTPERPIIPTPRAPPQRARGNPPGRCLCGLQPAICDGSSARADHRRKFYVFADVAAKARGKLPVIAPLALAAVNRMDVIPDIEREIKDHAAADRLAAGRARVALRTAGCRQLHAQRARQALQTFRRRQGDRLHA